MNNLHIRLPSGFFQEVPMSMLQGIDRRVDSEKWCGDERTNFKALKVTATTFVIVLIVWALFAVLS
jgi:hypothetical protein